MAVVLQRRALFRRLGGAPEPVRPPGSLGESDLDAGCTRCEACLDACPEAILVKGGGGLPVVDFERGGCTFCGACAEACEAGVIFKASGWPRRAQISDACLEPQGVTCRVCETSCDEAAFRFRPMVGGRSSVTVLDDRCTGCGACVSVCPADAITIKEPEEASCPQS